MFYDILLKCHLLHKDCILEVICGFNNTDKVFMLHLKPTLATLSTGNKEEPKVDFNKYILDGGWIWNISLCASGRFLETVGVLWCVEHFIYM